MPMRVRPDTDLSINASMFVEKAQKTPNSVAPSSVVLKTAVKVLSSVQGNTADSLTNQAQLMLETCCKVSMGELQDAHSLVAGANSEALKGLDKSFKGAPIAAQDGRGILRALTAGVMWANDHQGVITYYRETIRELHLQAHDQVFNSMDRFMQKDLFVRDAMNDSQLLPDWIAFFEEAASAEVAKTSGSNATVTSVDSMVSRLLGTDERMLNALSIINRRPIVIVDAAKTAESGKISGVCFSGEERNEFSISPDRDIREEFHARTLFVLQDGRRVNVLVTGEEPMYLSVHHDLEN
jgi:hypothetical protein